MFNQKAREMSKSKLLDRKQLVFESTLNEFDREARFASIVEQNLISSKATSTQFGRKLIANLRILMTKTVDTGKFLGILQSS